MYLGHSTVLEKETSEGVSATAQFAVMTTKRPLQMAYAHLLSRHLLSSLRNLADSRDNLQAIVLLYLAR